MQLPQPPHCLAEVAAVLARLTPQAARQHVAHLADLDITWARPAEALTDAVDLATRLDHHVFDALYHALALATPGAVLVTADRRYFAKAHPLGGIRWLPDFRLA